MADLRNIEVAADGSMALRADTYVNSLALAATTAEDLSVPDDATHVFFSSTGDFYAAYSGTATVPGDVTDGTAAELNPTVRHLGNGAASRTISLIAPAECVVTASFYRS